MSKLARVWAVGAALVALAASCGGHRHAERDPELDLEERHGGAEIEAGGELFGTEVGPSITHRELAKRRLVPDREATADELEALEPLMERAQEIRGLSFKQPVAVRVQSKEGMRRYLLEHIIDRSDIEKAHQRYIALGLLEPKTKIDKLLDEVSQTADLQGYYDPARKILVLRDDVAYGLTAAVGPREHMEWRSVIVHELVHALQDQHFDLHAAMQQERSTDEQHAFMALVEGDATLVMLQYLIGRVGLEFRPLIEDQYQLERMINGLPPTTGAGGMASPLSQQPAAFRYTAGFLFTAGLWREGGLRGLNRAYRRPPTTTQQVLDPLLYLSGEARTRCKLPPLTSLTQAGYRLLHQDTLGRIELAVYMQQAGLGGDMIARTWQCDRLAVLERKGAYASVWLVKMRDVDSVRGIVARANEGVGAAAERDKRPFLAYPQVDFAIIANNVDRKLHAALKRELSAWIMSSKALR